MAPPAQQPGAPPDAEALDAYSRTVTAVSERLRPSVAHLRVERARDAAAPRAVAAL